MLPVTTVDVTIADTQTTSTQINLEGRTIEAIVIPASFEGTSMTFQAALPSARGGDAALSWINVVDATGAAYTITVASSTYIILDRYALSGCRHLRLVAGTAQTGTATVTVVLGND